MTKKVVPKLRQEVKVKVDIVTSDDIKIYYTGKFQDFTARYIIKKLPFEKQKKMMIAKNFGPCQPARNAQADMGRYFLQIHLTEHGSNFVMSQFYFCTYDNYFNRVHKDGQRFSTDAGLCNCKQGTVLCENDPGFGK